MSLPIMNEDLRSIKTQKALFAAMRTLLKSSSFKKITIKGICEEALISRATFYAHFLDKYDLLKHWLTELWPAEFSGAASFEQLEAQMLHGKMMMIKNILNDADNETYSILYNYILSTIGLSLENGRGDTRQRDVVLANFYAGGLISYLHWQLDNKLPPEVPLLNQSLANMIAALRSWQSQ